MIIEPKIQNGIHHSWHGVILHHTTNETKQCEFSLLIYCFLSRRVTLSKHDLLKRNQRNQIFYKLLGYSFHSNGKPGGTGNPKLLAKLAPFPPRRACHSYFLRRNKSILSYSLLQIDLICVILKDKYIVIYIMLSNKNMQFYWHTLIFWYNVTKWWLYKNLI